MADLIVLMRQTRQTKNTIVFEAEEPTVAPVSSVYIKKGAGFDAATTITLTVATR